MADRPPNLLFITTDHQRADSLGMVQAGIEVTPSLNRLAARGTTFRRAYTTCPLCVPARTALATGKYPTHNGVVYNDWRGERAGDHRPLHQYLAEAGYQVAHIGVHHIRVRPDLSERVPFTRWISNFDHQAYLANRDLSDQPDDPSPFKKRIRENQAGQRIAVNYSSTATATWPHPAEDFLDAFFCREAANFLTAADPARPFALFLCLWAPHPPLRLPEPYASRFDPAALDLPPNVGQPAQGEPPGRRDGIAAQLAEDVSFEQWRRVWAAHLGLVNLADAGIGWVLAALTETGRAEETIILFTADHGDHLGQHRMYQKMEMYEQAIRVPLLVSGPGIQTQQIDQPVSHLDLVPTLLELCGLDHPPDLDGLSLWDTLASGQRPPQRPIFCQYSGNPTLGDSRRAVIGERYKYIYDPDDVAELYDLQTDPLEMTNLAAQAKFAPQIRQLHQLARCWADDHGDWLEY